MLKLIPDGGGGFFLTDPIADFEGGIWLTLLLVLVGCLIGAPFIIAPQIFAAAFACLIIAAAFIALLPFNAVLPIAALFAIYSLSSIVWGIMECLSSMAESLGPLVLLAWLGLAAILLVLTVPIYEASVPLACVYLVFAVPLWFTSMAHLDGHSGADFAVVVMMYVMRALTVVAAIAVVVLAVRGLIAMSKKKDECDLERRSVALKKSVVNASLSVAGIVPIVLCVILIGIVESTVGDIVVAIVCLLAYAGLALAARTVLSKMLPDVKGFAGALLAPLVFCLGCYFLSFSTMNFPSEFVEVVLSILRGMPFIGPACIALADFTAAFSTAFGELAYGVVSLVLIIFDTNIGRFTIPPAIVFILAFILCYLAARIGTLAGEKLKTKAAQ